MFNGDVISNAAIAALLREKLPDAKTEVLEALPMAFAEADPQFVHDALTKERGYVGVERARSMSVPEETPFNPMENREDAVEFLKGNFDSLRKSIDAGTPDMAFVAKVTDLARDPRLAGKTVFRSRSQHARALEDVHSDTYHHDVLAPLFQPRAATWGLKYMRVDTASTGGRSKKIVLLDTGIDKYHPDFFDRRENITLKRFVSDPNGDDHGHGTIMAGLIFGPETSAADVRYGVAYDARLFVGKIAHNNGISDDALLLCGLDWALTIQPAIVCIGVGRPVGVNDGYSAAVELAARRLLQKGITIIAPAGNSSDREKLRFEPVWHPANCPSILAIGAIDEDGRVANFSTRALNPTGDVDLVAPGVRVLSSCVGKRYVVIDGTSAAAAYATGVAALVAGETGKNGNSLWLHLKDPKNVERLPNLRSDDVGAGLITTRV